MMLVVVMTMTWCLTRLLVVVQGRDQERGIGTKRIQGQEKCLRVVIQWRDQERGIGNVKGQGLEKREEVGQEIEEIKGDQGPGIEKGQGQETTRDPGQETGTETIGKGQGLEIKEDEMICIYNVSLKINEVKLPMQRLPNRL